MPVFSKIKNGMLDLSGYRLEPPVIDGLATYIVEKSQSSPNPPQEPLRHLILDSNDMRDE